jgi:hypothetical protein
MLKSRLLHPEILEALGRAGHSETKKTGGWNRALATFGLIPPLPDGLGQRKGKSRYRRGHGARDDGPPSHHPTPPSTSSRLERRPEGTILSESSKLMSNALEPKLFGEHPRFSEALGGRKVLEVVDKAAHLVVQARILVIGAEDAFRIPPEVFDGVEVGTAFGQPQQLNVERLGQAQRALRRVAGIFI